MRPSARASSGLSEKRAPYPGQGPVFHLASPSLHGERMIGISHLLSIDVLASEEDAPTPGPCEFEELLRGRVAFAQQDEDASGEPLESACHSVLEGRSRLAMFDR